MFPLAWRFVLPTVFVKETPTLFNSSYLRHIYNFINHDDNEQFCYYNNNRSLLHIGVEYRPAQRHFNNNKHNKKYGLALTSHWNKSTAPYCRPPRAQKWSQNLHDFWPRNLNALWCMQWYYSHAAAETLSI